MHQSKWDQERYSQDKPKLSLKEIVLSTPLRYVLSLFIMLLLLFGLWRITEPASNPLPAGKLPIIRPLEGPTKIRPVTDPRENHEDKTIYHKLSDTEDSQKVENLLGGPEEPISRPLSLPDEFIGEFLEDKTETSSADLSSQKHEADASLPSSKKETPKDLPKEDVAEEDTPSNVAISGTNVKSSQSQASFSEERYCLQLGTLKTEEHAKSEWKRLSSRKVFKPYLSHLTPEFKKVDLGDEAGVRIRLIAGSFTKKEALALCQKLTKLSVDHKITLGCRVKKR